MSPELLELLWTASVRIPSSTIGQIRMRFFFFRQVPLGVCRILACGGAAIYRGGFARRCRSRGCSAMRTISQMHALSSSMQSHNAQLALLCAVGDASLPLYCHLHQQFVDYGRMKRAHCLDGSFIRVCVCFHVTRDMQLFRCSRPCRMRSNLRE